MGKWASYAKRGTARQFGVLTAPSFLDFAAGSITPTTFNVLRSNPAPLPATGIWARIRVSPAGAWTAPQFATSSSPFTGLTTATVYNYEAAWGTAATQLSDWSSPASVTTT